MKIKLTYLFTVLALLITPILAVKFTQVKAKGIWYSINLTPSSSSPVVNTAVTFTIYFYQFECNQMQSSGYYWVASSAENCNQHYGGVRAEKPIVGSGPDDTDPSATITVTGSGNTLSRTQIGPDGSGKGTFTLTSSVVEAKTVTATASSGGVDYSTTVTFVTPPAPNPTATPQTAKPTSPAPVVVAAPETPKPATISIGGQQVDSNNPIQITQGKSLVLSGKTVANGVVKLYIFSEPKTATVTADKDGNWTYAVTDLPPGDHHIESEVTDPATNKTSARASVLAFTVKAAEKNHEEKTTAPKKEPKKSKIGLILGMGAGTVLVSSAGGSYWWWRKKKHSPQATTNTPTETPSSVEKPDEPQSTNDQQSG